MNGIDFATFLVTYLYGLFLFKSRSRYIKVPSDQDTHSKTHN